MSEDIILRHYSSREICKKKNFNLAGEVGLGKLRGGLNIMSEISKNEVLVIGRYLLLNYFCLHL